MIEFIAMFTCLTMYLILFFIKEKYPLIAYPLISGTVLVVTLLVVYVITPFGDWFLG